MGWQNVARGAPNMGVPGVGVPGVGVPYTYVATTMGVPGGAPNNGRNKVWGTPEPYGLAECG